MAAVTITLAAAKSAALTYAAQANGLTDAVFGARLLEHALIPYEQGLAQTQTADALKLKTAFDAAKPTDTKEAILAKVSVAADVPAGEVVK
jgi:hypothetical protein